MVAPVNYESLLTVNNFLNILSWFTQQEVLHIIRHLKSSNTTSKVITLQALFK